MSTLKINRRALDAIIAGTKTIEVRANTEYGKYNLGPVTFVADDRSVKCNIVRITWYSNVRGLLTEEGVERTLSSYVPGSVDPMEDGVKSIESIGNYKSIIAERGVFALELELI